AFRFESTSTRSRSAPGSVPEGACARTGAGRRRAAARSGRVNRRIGTDLMEIGSEGEQPARNIGPSGGLTPGGTGLSLVPGLALCGPECQRVVNLGVTEP